MSELLTAIEWDKRNRSVGSWNDPMEFYQALVEKMELELEVSLELFPSTALYRRKIFVLKEHILLFSSVYKQDQYAAGDWAKMVVPFKNTFSSRVKET